MQRFTELTVWQLAHRLTLDVYALSASFPEHERHGLISQVRRAASSVAANIAEGSRRRSGSHFAHFLNTAEASLAETEYHLMLARDLGYTSELQVHGLFTRISELGRKLFALRLKVEGRVPNARSARDAGGEAP